MEKRVIISVDVGLTGGITVFEGKKQPIIHKIPIKKVKKSNKKTKTRRINPPWHSTHQYMEKDRPNERIRPTDLRHHHRGYSDSPECLR